MSLNFWTEPPAVARISRAFENRCASVEARQLLSTELSVPNSLSIAHAFLSQSRSLNSLLSLSAPSLVLSIPSSLASSFFFLSSILNLWPPLAFWLAVLYHRQTSSGAAVDSILGDKNGPAAIADGTRCRAAFALAKVLHPMAVWHSCSTAGIGHHTAMCIPLSLSRLLMQAVLMSCGGARVADNPAAFVALVHAQRFETLAYRQSLLPDAELGASPPWGAAPDALCKASSRSLRPAPQAAAAAAALCRDLKLAPESERELWVGNWLEMLALTCSGGDARATAAVLQQGVRCIAIY